METLDLVFPRAQLAALLLIPLLAGGCRSRADIERDYADRLRPSALDTSEAKPVAARAVKLRIYADADYQAHVLGWQQKVRAQIDRANAYLAPVHHVRFVPELRTWNRTSNSAQLDAALEELQKLDPATDCDWVLGLTGVLPVATSDFHHIGMSLPFSKYMVAHAMDDVAEADAFRKTFDALSDDERLELYRDRLRHKEVAVLLHEWAHTLGAVHSRIESDLMYGSYDNREERFGPPNAEIIEQNLAARLSGENPDSPAAREVQRVALSRDGCPACDQDDPALVALRAGASGKPASPSVSPAAAKVTSPVLAKDDPAQERYRTAAERLKAGDAAGAWTIAGPLADAHPDRLAFQEVACVAGIVQKAPPDARAVCARWLGLAPKAVRPALSCAWADYHAGDTLSANRRLRELEPQLGAEPSTTWLDFANLAENLNLVSIVERAVAHVDAAAEAQRLRDWSVRSRRRLGLPADAARLGIAADDEAAYLAAVTAAEKALDKSQISSAQRLASEALKRWPNGPGLLAISCQVHESRRELDAARSTCQAAIRADQEAVWAHFTLALLGLDTQDLAGAGSELERVIALDPTIHSAWKNLIQVRKAQKNAAEVERLERAYRERFGAPP